MRHTHRTQLRLRGTYLILRELARHDRAVLVGDTAVFGPPPQVALAPGVEASLVAGRSHPGLLGYGAGPRVHVVDRLGLGDPLSARLRLAQRGRPGHEKLLDEAWIVARFGDPSEAAAARSEVEAARRALACGELAKLLAAVTEPMSWRRFVENVREAPALPRLRLPARPSDAAAELCGSGS